ncbi:hypothetical protein Tco_0610482 [Tanacetum coccineum]
MIIIKRVKGRDQGLGWSSVCKAAEVLVSFVLRTATGVHELCHAADHPGGDSSLLGPSSSTGRHLTQEEAAKEALALKISQRFALLEGAKLELDGIITEEEEKAIIKVKGEALKEKDDPEAFIFPIRLEGKVNENALADTGSDINIMPYWIYEKLGIEEIKKGQQRDHNN